jgi:hypothetical protein
MEAKKKRAAFLARATTLYSFLFEDIALIERELGPTDEEVLYYVLRLAHECRQQP